MHSSYASSQVQVFVQLVCTKDKANVIQASKVSKIKISASSCTPVFFTVGRRVSIYVETLLHCGTVGFRSSLSQNKPANYPSLSTEGPWGFVPLRVKTNQPTIKSLHSGTAGFRSFQGQNRPADYPSLSTVGPWGFVLPKVKTNQPTSQVSPQRNRGVSFLQKSRQTSQLSTSIKEAIRYASRSPLPPSCLVKFKNKELNLEQHLQKKQFWL